MNGPRVEIACQLCIFFTPAARQKLASFLGFCGAAVKRIHGSRYTHLRVGAHTPVCISWMLRSNDALLRQLTRLGRKPRQTWVLTVRRRGGMMDSSPW